MRPLDTAGTYTPGDLVTDIDRLAARRHVASVIADTIIGTLDQWIDHVGSDLNMEHRLEMAGLSVYLLWDALDALSGRERDPEARNLDQLDDLMRQEERRFANSRRRQVPPDTEPCSMVPVAAA